MRWQLRTLAKGLEEQSRCRCGDVEGLDPAAAREGEQPVAGGGDAGAEALALAAEDEDRRPGEVGLPGGGLGLGVGPPDPEAGALRLWSSPLRLFLDPGNNLNQKVGPDIQKRIRDPTC